MSDPSAEGSLAALAGVADTSNPRHASAVMEAPNPPRKRPRTQNTPATLDRRLAGWVAVQRRRRLWHHFCEWRIWAWDRIAERDEQEARDELSYDWYGC